MPPVAARHLGARSRAARALSSSSPSAARARLGADVAAHRRELSALAGGAARRSPAAAFGRRARPRRVRPAVEHLAREPAQVAGFERVEEPAAVTSRAADVLAGRAPEEVAQRVASATRGWGRDRARGACRRSRPRVPRNTRLPVRHSRKTSPQEKDRRGPGARGRATARARRSRGVPSASLAAGEPRALARASRRSGRRCRSRARARSAARRWGRS